MTSALRGGVFGFQKYQLDRKHNYLAPTELNRHGRQWVRFPLALPIFHRLTGSQASTGQHRNEEAGDKLDSKILKFKNGLAALPQALRKQAGEDFDTHLTAIQSILRVARNESGHAEIAKPPTREQVYVYLQLFIPFAEQVGKQRHALGS